MLRLNTGHTTELFRVLNWRHALEHEAPRRGIDVKKLSGGGYQKGPNDTGRRRERPAVIGDGERQGVFGGL